jgi:N-acetylmuramoyl-L-alanine amidase
MEDAPFSREVISRKKPAYSIFGALQSVLAIAIVSATLFTMWTPANLFSDQMINQILNAWNSEPAAMAVVSTPTALPPARIGIVAGHRGHDSGAVCPDGLREVDVNTIIASLVQSQLTEEGFQVEILDEFDERLYGFQGVVLVSIHNDSCIELGPDATGFKVAATSVNSFPEKSQRLSKCLIDRYHTVTDLPFHANTITIDMTDYHSFNEIHSETTAAIIETGFLNRDKAILTDHPDVIAEGITAGILCFIRNEDLSPYVESYDTP